MKRPFIFIALLLTLGGHCAMADNVIIKGDTLWTIFSSPFDSYPGIVKLRGQHQDYSTQCTEDNCSFLSTWKVIRNKLMLVKIESCKCNEKHQTANLKSLFGSRLKKGMLAADWYSGEIWVTKDQPNSWGGLFAASWPSETRLIVKNGEVISIKDFVYPKPVIRPYYKNSDSLNQFIYTHLDWARFHDLPRQIKWSYFRFDQDGKGYLINIRPDTSFRSQPTLDEAELAEIRRVLGLLQWPLYYYHGQPVKSFNQIGLQLTKATQEKYTKPD